MMSSALYDRRTPGWNLLCMAWHAIRSWVDSESCIQESGDRSGDLTVRCRLSSVLESWSSRLWQNRLGHADRPDCAEPRCGMAVKITPFAKEKKKKNAKFSLFSHCIDSKMGLFCLVSTGTNDHVCFESQAPPLANQRPLHGGLLGATWPLGRISFPVFCLQTKRG